MILDSLFLQWVDVHEDSFHHFHIIGISFLCELNFEDDIIEGIGQNVSTASAYFGSKTLFN